MKNLLITISLFFTYNVYSQIGIAVAKDDNGSSVRWQVVYNEGWETESVARAKLKEQGYTNVYTLTGGEQRGHNLTSGYWIVVEAVRTNYEGKRITSFGLGASSSSYAEAEERAVSNLSQYDWSWKKSDGYTVVKRSTFN